MKITRKQLRRIISEAGVSSLEGWALAEMGDYGPDSLGDWSADDYMSYFYELAEDIEMANDRLDDHESTIKWAKLQFPELEKEIEELFSEDGARYMEPVFEAFDDMNDSEHPMASSPVLQGEEASFRVSDVKSEDGEEYRWWIWGNNLNPVPFELEAGGTDRDGKHWTAEEIFQEITGGKVSRFRTPKGLSYD